jgi:hypothetical protein
MTTAQFNRLLLLARGPAPFKVFPSLSPLWLKIEHAFLSQSKDKCLENENKVKYQYVASRKLILWQLIQV